MQKELVSAVGVGSISLWETYYNIIFQCSLPLKKAWGD